MNLNQKFTEGTALVAVANPVSVSAGTAATGWVKAADFALFAAVIATGVLGTSATLDAKLQQATDSSGTGAKDITGKSITQLVKASHDNKQVIINLRADELDVNNAFTHFRLSVTVGTAASVLTALVLGTGARYEPANAYNLASVVQVV